MDKGFLFVLLSSKYTRRVRLGFSIIELMVTMAIMAVILSTVLANYPESSVRINLAIINHETALAIRESQLRGSAVDSKDLSIGGYGLYFNLNNADKYVYFSDFATDPGPNGLDVGDGVYSSLPGVNETIATTTYPKNFRFNKLCIGKGYPFDTTNGGSCNDNAASGFPVISTLTIAFIRPKPRPVITVNQDDVVNKRTNLAAACMESISPRGPSLGNTRSVHVYLSGRIVTSETGCQ